eukprot:s1168_g13.t1
MKNYRGLGETIVSYRLRQQHLLVFKHSDEQQRNVSPQAGCISPKSSRSSIMSLKSSGGASPKRVSKATSGSSVTEDSSSASESEHEDAETMQSQRDAKVSVPKASASSGSPKAAKAAPKSPSSPKAKAKASSSTSSSQVLKPPSPKAERRRSSNSLVPKELQGQAGADFEAAKVRRAVKAAAQRVKAHKNPRAKKKLTSRSELLACLFNALGGYVTNYLSSNQLLRMAWLLGFEGGEAEWDKEYVVLCRSYNWNATLGASRRQFAELLADEDSDTATTWSWPRCSRTSVFQLRSSFHVTTW